MPPKEVPDNAYESSRFLAQATYGGTEDEIARMQRTRYVDWVVDQFKKSPRALEPVLRARMQANPELEVSTREINDAYWKLAVTADDQLRQRVTFALSQIFVVSLNDGAVSGYPLGLANYHDTVAKHAFLNFRDLLEAVTLHPMMGLYLSHLRNRKEDPKQGRVPDENFAREVMQLFTIGVHELEQDGTVRLDERHEPIETYTNEDVTGLAKVFTGWSWGGPDTTDQRFHGSLKDPRREVLPMQPYPQFHSTSEKRFLGVVVPEQSSADPRASLAAALDRLAGHPNVGPFIGRQLIQRLVTSNPSPEYVARVAAQFADNGEGTRGDMRAVIRAVLLDQEARDPVAAANPVFGRLREPVLRLAHWLRAFGARSVTNEYLIGPTDNPATSLGQSAFRAPSVFNFYRPGYVPPNTPVADAGMVSPEMQITHETSVAGYLNLMRGIIERGAGSGNPRDVRTSYGAEIGIADNPALLAERMNLLLLAGGMSPGLRSQLEQAIGSINLPTGDAERIERARRNRVYLAIYLAMASPEYLVQR
ncbi:MAG: DUF1800 domain-containing protein [Burkholderiaceae bacterium]|nr:DUF1800 domain-containing protein [Burkholderiaceae bacterium]